jgi:hypothetical protein
MRERDVPKVFRRVVTATDLMSKFINGFMAFFLILSMSPDAVFDPYFYPKFFRPAILR